MTDELEAALRGAIRTKNDLLNEARKHAEVGLYGDAARYEAEARGARKAAFAILDHLEKRPSKMRPFEIIRAIEHQES